MLRHDREKNSNPSYTGCCISETLCDCGLKYCEFHTPIHLHHYWKCPVKKAQRHAFDIEFKIPYYRRFCQLYGVYLFHLWCVNHNRFLPHLYLLTDPLNSGGFLEHFHSFAWNFWYVDVWWPIKHWFWKKRHPREYQERLDFMNASRQAMEEGMADPMPVLDGPLSGLNLSGAILGSRFFSRMKEILDAKKKIN